MRVRRKRKPAPEVKPDVQEPSAPLLLSPAAAINHPPSFTAPVLYVNGLYVLYSVGWNEADDGGAVVLGKGGEVDRLSGDWVWQTVCR